jgi:hypothetical protein
MNISQLEKKRRAKIQDCLQHAGIGKQVTSKTESASDALSISNFISS